MGAVSIAALMFCFAWVVAEAWRNFPGASNDSIMLVLRPAWLGWLIAGVLTGKDLFWHPALHKFRALGLSVRTSYFLGVPLGFLSLPLLAIAFVLVARSYEGVTAVRGGLAAFAIAFVLASQTAMLCISLARNVLLRSDAFPARLIFAAAAVLIAAVGSAMAPSLGLMPSRASAVDLLAATMRGRPWPMYPAMVIVVLLTIADASFYSKSVRSGLRGDRVFPVAWAERLRTRRRFWAQGGSHALTSIAMLGWLRNRASLLLFVWGLGYGFGYVFVTRPAAPISALGFFWMVSMFHSYLRGNLFGVDRRAAWWYSVIPQGLLGGLAAKNRALSQLQYVMCGGVLLAFVASGRPAFRQVDLLVALVSCVVTMATIAEMVGSVTSVRWPDPIERASQYSGGTALGAFVVPVASTIVAGLLAVLVAATPARVSATAAALVALGFAVGVKALQALHRRTSLVDVIAHHGEDMRKQLAAFKT